MFLIFQVFLTLEPRIFKFHDESIFRYHNGKKFSKYNREFDAFQDRLFEYNISFIPRYKLCCLVKTAVFPCACIFQQFYINQSDNCGPL